MKRLEDNEYLKFIKSFCTIDLKLFRNSEAADIAILLFKPQISYASQINSFIEDMFFKIDFEKISDELKLLIKTTNFKKCIEVFESVLNTYSKITLENGNEIVNKVIEISGLKGKELFLPIRLATIAQEHGPEMNKILFVVGKTQILKNIAQLKG
jgi:glutamyl/glutaminyl-tRNA synthetase